MQTGASGVIIVFDLCRRREERDWRGDSFEALCFESWREHLRGKTEWRKKRVSDAS